MKNTFLPNTEPNTIGGFCLHIMARCREIDFENDRINYNYSNISIETLSQEFINYFGLPCPLTLIQILLICFYSGFFVHWFSDNHKPRGYNFDFRDEVHIYIKENDSPSGQIFTVLHELYEIIDQKIYSYISGANKRVKELIEEKANQFSSCVLLPSENVSKWINSNGLDVFGLKNFYNCSYATALIRMNEVLCNLSDEKTGGPTPMIGILYERPYWKQNRNCKTPPLQLKFYKKSRGFPFSLSRSEIKDLHFCGDKTLDKTVEQLIDPFSKSNNSVFLHNAKMAFEDYELTVDILIRTVNWREYKYTAKVLIQIIPSSHKDLSELAYLLGIKRYNIDIHASTDEVFTEEDHYRLLSELNDERSRWQSSYLLDIDIP